MIPTKKQIEEIAGNLECGMRCFFHLKTGEIETLLNLDHWIEGDDEFWEEEAQRIEENIDDYFEFEGMESHESYQIMADFAKSVDDKRLQIDLENALSRRKPFQNFKWEIDNSGEYRQQWFDFKKMRFIQWVVDQLESNK